MSTVLFLVPLALFLGAVGLAAFLWSLSSGQFDDLEGAAMRILLDDHEMEKAEPKEQSSEAIIKEKKDDV